MSCCTKTYNLGCFNNCSIIAVGLCENSGTYNGIFTYGNISTTITVTAIVNEPFLFDLSLLNENATFTLAIYDENENQITLTIDSVDYDCFKVKTQVDSVKVTQGTIIGCSPMCKEIYDPNDENTAVLFTVAVDGTTITGDGTVGNPLIAIGGGGGGGIESIVAGDNITIDNTDPENPIISATDNASALFPNGLALIEASRDFQASDEGKLLILFPNATLTMPDTLVFSGLFRTIGIMRLDTTSWFEQEFGGTKIKSLTTTDFKYNEIVLCLTSVTDDDSASRLLFTSTTIIEEQTALKYLYDQSQNVIPLSGTEIGKPVTGDIETYDGFNIHTPNAVNPNKKNGVFLQSSGVSIEYQNNSLSSKIITNENGIEINCDNVGSRGLISGQDFTANITDFDYTQKIYVDSLATSKQDALVSGTNIKTINGSSILGSGDMTVGGQVDILQIQMFI